MIKSTFSYLKLTAVVAVLAIAIIGLNGLVSRTTVAREKTAMPPREIASTLEQNFTTPVVATERDATISTLPTTEICQFGGGVQITALERTRNLVDDKVEVGWNFTMPPPLAALGECVKVEYFIVHVTVFYESGGSKDKYQHAGALARNEVVRFSDIARRVKRIEAEVQAEFKTIAHSNNATLGKNF